MEQIKLFIKKAKTDGELMAKLDVLGAGNAETGAVTALAAEYGFTFSAEEYEQAKIEAFAKKGELGEVDLEAVSGGSLVTQNRYDPNVCPKLKRTRYECVGFLSMCWCEHYRLHVNYDGGPYQHVCAMGAFRYEGDYSGEPR